MNGTQYPLVSLCIFTYNQEKYIREAVEGALSQDYPNLEIIISDDNSTDSTYDIIAECTRKYDGPHRLLINQNSTNLGLVRHYNKVIYELTHGDYVLCSAGDDICMPHLTTNALEQLLKSDCSSMAFNAYIIDGDSNQTGILSEDINHHNEVYSLDDFLSGHYKTNGACRIMKRDLFETFGPLNEDCQTEDTPTRYRLFLYGKVGYCYSPNIKYRVHGNNISSSHNLLTKFEPRLIAKQYQKDLNVAADKGLISNSGRKQIQKKINYYIYSQTAIRKLYQHKFIIRFVLLLWYCVDWRLSLGTKKSFILSVLLWMSSDIKALKFPRVA